MKIDRVFVLGAVALFLSLLPGLRGHAVDSGSSDRVTVDWDKVIGVSKTTATLQLGAFPPNRRGSKLHDQMFEVLKNIGADYVRYVPWMTYPRLAVAEI